MTLCERITSLIQDDDEHGSNIWPNKAMWNDSLNVPGNGATKWVTAPEDYDYVYNSARSDLIFDHRLLSEITRRNIRAVNRVY